MRDTSSFRAFSEDVKRITSTLFVNLADPSDDEVTRRVIFKEALLIVFRSLSQELFRARQIAIARDNKSSGQRHRRATAASRPTAAARQTGAAPAKQNLFLERLEAIQLKRLPPSRIEDCLDIMRRATHLVFHERSIPIEFVGMVFEELYGAVPELDRNGTFILKGSIEKRDSGVFFTHPELVKFLTRLTLDPLLAQLNSPAELLRIRVVDPAAGAGFFLLESLRLLSAKLVALSGGANKLSPSEARCLVAANCVYGVDVDSLAVEVAKILIWLEVGSKEFSRCSIDQRIKTGDSLLGLPLEHLETVNGSPQSIGRETERLHVEQIREILAKRSRSAPSQELAFRPFCWELHFPEVFLDAKGRRKKGGGFTVVLSNPPWGKIKTDFKEFHSHIDERVSLYQGKALRRYVKNSGHAGSRTALKEAWSLYAAQMKSYASLLQDINVYKAQRIEVNGRSTGGDADLYKYFMERAFQLLSPSGRIGLIVPAAFHRSEGATGVRHLYWENGTFEQFLEFENRKRLFPIHSMFKFLLMAYQRGRRNGIRKAAFGLSTVEEAAESCSRNSSRSISLARGFPERVSGSLLTIPEIRSKTERDLFIKLHSYHPILGDSAAGGWNVSFVRELDMTNDSEAFRNKTQLQRLRCKENGDGSWSSPQGEVYLPLLEGRMVHQYDYAAKAYRGGQGRTSQWVPLPFAEKTIAPHYFVPSSYFRGNRREDIPPRAGFCDITGHANERTVLAALIPHGFPCGNKVPTCVFDSSDPRVHLIWLAIANSFVIDWIVRRRISITLNFFHWYQIPFPRVEPNSEVGCELAVAAARLSYLQMQQTKTTEWLREAGGKSATNLGELASLTERAQLRANIDAIVAELFSLTHEEFALILSDFPLLDRYQRSLAEDGNRSAAKTQKNNRSTVTRDKALLAYFLRRGETPPKNINELPVSHTDGITDLSQRVALAEQLGAIAYIPSELAGYSR
jgi:hypothetical protein